MLWLAPPTGKPGIGFPYCLEEDAMRLLPETMSPRRIGAAAGMLLAAALACTAPAAAQQAPAAIIPRVSGETIDQFNAANAESRRYAETQSQLRNDALILRNDRARALLTCQGAGSAAAAGACDSNAAIAARQRGLQLDNKALGARDTHSLILQGIGVHSVP